jgi:low affinity Fe/Cu permease
MSGPSAYAPGDEIGRAKEAPHLHVPRMVVSRDVAGEGVLDRIADVVNRLIGSMWLFVGISLGIVAWLFAGNVVGFDRTPWPLLLTILNLPQLSIMISLQVSANRAQAASDARARADHATLVALHELSKKQVRILDGQNEVLDILRQAVASGDPGPRRPGTAGPG